MAYCLRVPILLEGRVTAVFILGHACAPIWTQEDKDHGRQLADQFAVAQSNSRLISEVQQLHWGTMTALARAIDAKSHWTMGHSERVTELAIKIAKAIGLPPRELDIIRRGGLLHDIGKIGTPAEILDKPGKLTVEELGQMRERVNIGLFVNYSNRVASWFSGRLGVQQSGCGGGATCVDLATTKNPQAEACAT